MSQAKKEIPGLDTGSGASRGREGAAVTSGGGKPIGPVAAKATLTHSTPVSGQAGENEKATGHKKVGINKQFEFMEPNIIGNLSLIKT